MASKEKRLSLADKISSLVTAAPTTFNSDDEYDDTTAKVVDRDDEADNSNDSDVQVPKLRKHLDLLDELDKRYEGKKVSRRTLQSNSLPSDSEEDLDSNDSSISEENVKNGARNSTDNEDTDLNDSRDDEPDEDEDEEDSGDDDEPELEVDETNPLRRGSKSTESNFQHMSMTDAAAEIEKGNCVRSQLGIWESLLEMRIKLQKCLVSSNQMPQFDKYNDLKKDQNFTKTTNETKTNISKLLNNLLDLQSALLKNYPETKQLAKDNANKDTKQVSQDAGMDEEIPSDSEEEIANDSIEEEEDSGEENEDKVPRKKRRIEDYETLLSKNHKLYTDYRNSIIQKWNDKTRVAVGNVNNKGSTQPVVKQIEFILSDKSKLRKRTQLKRSEYDIIGKERTTDEDKDGRRTQEYDSEIYDDDDFYHQLLRELIEFKSSDVTDPIQLSKQWIQLQNMRSKMKRKIDTKATKGRRIRFGIHSKLVNFMAPITVDDLWSDEAKNELYNSLFGKIKVVEQK